MGKIIDYPVVTEIDDNDVLLVDGQNGTRLIKKSDLKDQLYNELASQIKLQIDNEIINENIYSASEKKIGKFYGKDLFRKCFDIGDGSSYGFNLNGTAQSVGIAFGFDASWEVVNYDIKVMRTDGGIVYFNNNFIVTAGASEVTGWYNKNDKKCYIYMGTQYNSSGNRGKMKIILCVEYIKENI